MDRKEAILRIKEHMKHHGIGKYPHLKLKEALDMAIAALSPPNEPLTLEQLRKMDGKPVWVKCLNSKKYISPPVGWRILEKSITGRIGVWDGENCLIERNYGTDWLAYTYHPAHIDREAWTAEWKDHYKSGVHAGTGAICSSCDV